MQRAGDSAYKIELPGDMNISATFNVGDLTTYIDNEDEDNADLRENFIQRGKVDMKQVKQSNLHNHIKAMVHIGPMITFEQVLYTFSLPKSLLT